MKIFSSIPPAHANGLDYIQMCVKSWQKHGEVYSVNHPDEIMKIRDLFPDVTFLPTFQTQRAFTGKPLVTIDSIINEMRFHHEGKTMFINADCHLTENNIDDYFQKDKMVYLHRINYNDMPESGVIYRNGIDAFLFTNLQIMEKVQATQYCIGQTYFDLFYPYAISMAGMELCTTNAKVIYHKNHKEQHSASDWVRFGEYTGLIIGKKMIRPAQVSEFLYHYLRAVTIII